MLGKALVAEVERLHPACPTHTTEVPAADLGTQAPTIISDDLLTFGVSLDPGTLQLIKTGDIEVGLGFDAPVVAWTEMDSLARLTTGQPVAPGAAADVPPQQFLTAEVLADRDLSRGWAAYPDFQHRSQGSWSQAS